MLVSEESKREYSDVPDQELYHPKFQANGYESDSESIKQYRLIQRERNRQFAQTSQSCCGRFKEIFKICIPISFSLILQLAIDFANIYFSGHFENSKYLAANGLSLSILNIFGFATMYGWASAVETLGSHAFGSGNFMLNGHYFNQARLTVLIGSLVFIVPLFLFSGSLLQLVGVSQEIASLTGRYLTILLPGAILQIQSTVVRKFFRTQRVGWVSFAVIAFAAPMHIAGLYFWVDYMNYGFDAIPAWTVATYTFSVCGMYFYLYCCEIAHKQSLIRFSCQTFRDLSTFTRTAFSSMLLTCLEWWSFQITVIALSFLGQSYLSAHVILLNIGGFLYLSSSFSFSVTATALVGNSLGLGPSKLSTAKKYAIQTVVYGMLINFGLISTLYFCKDTIISLITVNQVVIDLVEGVFYLLLIEDMLEVFGGILNGILRGLGQFKIPVLVTTVGFFFIYQPLSLYFAFNGYYLKAIWGGLIVIVSLIVISYLLLILCYNWKDISEKHRQLAENYFNEEIKQPLLLNSSK